MMHIELRYQDVEIDFDCSIRSCSYRWGLPGAYGDNDRWMLLGEDDTYSY